MNTSFGIDQLKESCLFKIRIEENGENNVTAEPTKTLETVHDDTIFFLWNDLDNAMITLMGNPSGPDIDDYNISADEYEGFKKDVKEWAEERGKAQGIALALSYLENCDVSVIKSEAKQRYNDAADTVEAERQGAPENDEYDQDEMEEAFGIYTDQTEIETETESDSEEYVNYEEDSLQEMSVSQLKTILSHEIGFERKKLPDDWNDLIDMVLDFQEGKISPEGKAE